MYILNLTKRNIPNTLPDEFPISLHSNVIIGIWFPRSKMTMSFGSELSLWLCV